MLRFLYAYVSQLNGELGLPTTQSQNNNNNNKFVERHSAVASEALAEQRDLLGFFSPLSSPSFLSPRLRSRALISS